MDRVPYGKYEGKQWSEVPLNYLEFVGNQDVNSELPELCRKELDKRKAKVKEIRIMPSVVDSASFVLLTKWKQELHLGTFRRGLYSYALFMAKKAVEDGEMDANGNIYYAGCHWKVDWGQIYPSVKDLRLLPAKPRDSYSG